MAGWPDARRMPHGIVAPPPPPPCCLRHCPAFAEILPKHFGWPTVFSGRPKLERWWAAVQKDAEAARVRACVLAMQLF